MVMLIDADLSSGKGVLLAVFVAFAAYLFVMTGGLTLILGLALIGLGLAIIYYVGVRIHRWAAGKRRQST